MLSFDAGAAEPVEADEEDDDSLGMGADMVGDVASDDGTAGVDFLARVAASVDEAAGFDSVVDCFFATGIVASEATDEITGTAASDGTADGFGVAAFGAISFFGCVDEVFFADFKTGSGEATLTFASLTVPFDAAVPALAPAIGDGGGWSTRLHLSNAAFLPSPVATTLPQLVENQR